MTEMTPVTQSVTQATPVKTPALPDAQTVTEVRHWTDRLFSFRVTRPQALRFRSGEFVMIGLLGDNGKPLCRADLYLGSSGFNAQMKYADRRGAVCAIIQGSSERDAGTVVIKDLILGAELAAASRDVKDSAEHKAKQAEAQFSVPVEGLVEGVKTVLARHS